MCVLANLEYLSILFCAVFWAAAPGLVAVCCQCGTQHNSGTVTFPLIHGKRVVPSGRLLSSRIRLIGSLTAGIRTRLIAVLRIMVMTLNRRRHSACCSRPHLAVLMMLCVFVCSSGFTEACRCVHWRQQTDTQTTSTTQTAATRCAVACTTAISGDYIVRWRRGVVVSGVRRMNEVNAPGWVTVLGRVYHLGM